jgi:DNA-binding protein HU-beta
MTKEELVKSVSAETGLTIKDCNMVLGSFAKNLEKCFKKSDSIRLPEIGTFGVKRTNARKGKNPQTGKEIDIPAKNVVTFKAAKSIRENINKK